ncbi:6-phosphogluconate dehydrogenase [Cucumis melo var. makuwa]|uniref:6-phosphogluconate dehydrogenase n=1 Tax=Cucumis melo var. makuwa TaxID=1194695 RepID=A0A5A7TIB3_CUCMM|nr:6-phosphogluconate dehydrogenase [Cucumis melo var. makuwa]TYK30807.1 6-phosphogluconate dehydrogenase [Cucumis melo var. makuwa]
MKLDLYHWSCCWRARLPANLVEAQRDLFGAHTYEQVDCLDSYHTGWTKLARNADAGVGIFN